ncbi:MAG: response regulator [Candidatus Cloacimonadales bacterium]
MKIFMKTKMILVDDNKMIRESMQKFLAYDFEVQAYSGGQEALLFAEKNPPAILVTDYYLEDETGLELIEEMRKINPQVITVLFTGYPNSYLAQKIPKYSVDLYFTKPLILHSFIAKIKEIINKKEVV